MPDPEQPGRGPRQPNLAAAADQHRSRPLLSRRSQHHQLSGRHCAHRHLRNHVELTVTSDALPGVTRNFDSFQAAAHEAGLSRIFAGQHTRIDVNAGNTLGRRVAEAVLNQPFGIG